MKLALSALGIIFCVALIAVPALATTSVFTADADNWMDHGIQSSNNGTDTYTSVEMYRDSSNNKFARHTGLLHFDISSLPNNITIQSVKVSLCFQYWDAHHQGDWMDISLFGVKPARDWTELDSCWNYYKSYHVPWAIDGADHTSDDRDFTAGAVRRFDDGALANNYYDWTGDGLTNLVRAWYDGTRINRGWVLRATDMGLITDGSDTVRLQFHSKDQVQGYRPLLYVNYTVVPEPRGLMLLACGLTGLVGFARRRK